MKITSLLLLVALAIPLFVAADEKRFPCWETAMTQMAMNDCAVKELKAAEEEMASVYEEIKKRSAEDKAFLARLENAQIAWAAFRDAEVEAIFPHADKLGEYGSVYPMCLGVWKTNLTRERTKQLRRWLDGTIEGESCAGSIPIKLDSRIHRDQ
jgi:uncharacterized protein YecT (DUF1311 family)